MNGADSLLLLLPGFARPLPGSLQRLLPGLARPLSGFDLANIVRVAAFSSEPFLGPLALLRLTACDARQANQGTNESHCIDT